MNDLAAVKTRKPRGARKKVEAPEAPFREEVGPTELYDPVIRNELKKAVVWIGMASLVVALVWLAQPILLIIGGLVLAAMLPRRTEAIMARARTYADQRVVCGHHYRSDVEASAVLAAVLVRDLMSRPAFLGKVNASLAELRGASLDQ